MIRVSAASRLHFGLLSLPASGVPAARWPNRLGEDVVPARWFGGVGLMVEAPGVRLTAEPAAEWSSTGPLADRVLAFAQRFAQAVPVEQARPQRLHVEQSAPEHAGLGTGTQLGLAVARALASAWRLDDLDAAELARRVGRGARSALGVYGFARGGLLVEAGKRAAEALAPLLTRVEFPNAWRLVLAVPPGPPGLHGHREVEAFAQLRSQPASLARTDALCRLVLLGLLPALLEGDLEGFGEALYDFNLRVGEAFAPIQGGPYANAHTAAVVAFLRRQGARGAGQSSWGPAAFGIVADEEEAQRLACLLREQFGFTAAEAFATGPCNRGVVVEQNGERQP